MEGIMSRQEKGMQIIAHIVMILFSITAILPFWLLISASFSDPKYAVAEGYRFIPEKLSLAAYSFILKQWNLIGQAYLVTFIVTIAGTFLSITLVSMLAYGLSQNGVPGSKIIFGLILITMLFSGGIVPQYMIYNNVFHLKNTLLGLLIPNLLLNGFTVILVRNYFQQNIPRELIEASEIDGAGQFLIFRRVVLPLSSPILATVGLMEAIMYWNDWTNGLYYITNEKLYSMQQLLNAMNNNIQFMANNAKDFAGVDISSLPTATMRLAIAVIAILPIIAAYPFFQKYFVKGITLGAVKG